MKIASVDEFILALKLQYINFLAGENYLVHKPMRYDRSVRKLSVNAWLEDLYFSNGGCASLLSTDLPVFGADCWWSCDSFCH